MATQAKNGRPHEKLVSSTQQRLERSGENVSGVSPLDEYFSGCHAVLRGSVNLRALRQTRIDAELSMEHAAAFAGIGRNTLQRIENGKADPRITTLRKILDLYGDQLGSFLSIDDYIER